MLSNLRIPAVVLLAAACTSARPASTASFPAHPDSARIRADIEYLASDALEGRGTGTAGNDSAAAFIARRYRQLGLREVVPGYLQPFSARPAMLAHSGGPAALPTQNVVALLPGTDSSLAGQVIVIGAHLDHLGRSTTGALDDAAGAAIRNGADDNASGTAAVMELARLLSQRPLRRPVLFANFSAEELGLLGSRHLVQEAPVPVDSMVVMLNFDMVGRLRGDSLIVYGLGTAKEMPALLDSANASVSLRLRTMPDGFGPSDHSSFYARGVPVLHFFTDLHEDYHRASDDASLVNAAGAARVVQLAEAMARRIDAADAPLTFVNQPAPAPARAGSNVYLGSIPDMAAGETTGLRLTGVRAGSPADSAGLRAGDTVVELGGVAVTDLQTYSDALYSHQPGDTVAIVVMRGGQRLTFRVRLGRRG